MELYISYYDNYISIVEGKYSTKKNKYIIKKHIKASIEDVEIQQEDKYSLLKEVIKNNKFNSKDVTFMLNTRDVIVKSNTVPKVDKKDLVAMMNNEIYEMMSLDSEEYVFSYEVTNEKEVDNKQILDVVTAAINKKEVNEILKVFKELKLNLKCIDIMSTSYIRLLKNIEYEDMMVINIGRYGSYCGVYTNDSLFIYDNIPIKVSKNTEEHTLLSLVDEIKGLANFYSSRNFGKNLKDILILGEGNDNPFLKDIFTNGLNNNLIFGIENLYYISEEVQGDIREEEISHISEVLGCMLVNKKKDLLSYPSMNLLPLNLKNELKVKEKVKKTILMLPLLIIILTAPYFIFSSLESKTKEEIKKVNDILEQIIVKYNDIGSIEEEINTIEEEIKVYDMLLNKKTNWTSVLNSIERNIPYLIDLTSINVYYESTLNNSNEEESEITEDTTENNNIINNIMNNQIQNQYTDDNEQSEENLENEMFNKIPNVISLEGIANSSEKIGQFVYKLNGLDYFESVNLKYSEKNKDTGMYNFQIILKIKSGVVSNE